MTEYEMTIFFDALVEKSKTSDNNRIDLLEISEAAKAKLIRYQAAKTSVKKNLADVILIALNKNQEHVKAVKTKVVRDNVNTDR